jgi:parvulin-like peptidyl-prolyl isomerase
VSDSRRIALFSRGNASLLGLVVALGCQGGSGGPGVCGPGKETVGRLDGDALDCVEFMTALREDQGEAFFERFVERKVVEREAQRQGVSVDPAQLEKAVAADLADTLRSRFNGDRKAMEAQLSKYGVGFETWRLSRVREKETDLLVRGLMAKGPSDAAIDTLFTQRFGKDGLRRRIRQMFFSASPEESRLYPRAEYEAERQAVDAEAKALAERLRQRVESGEDFASVARAASEDTAAERGGELGEGMLARLGPDLEAAVARLSPGQRTPVVAGPRGFHVFQFDGVRKGAHFQGAHLFVSAARRGSDDSRTEAARFEEARARIDAARARIVAGAPFGEVAREVTDDAVTRDRNGDLGAFDTGRLGPEVDAALESAPLNAPSEIVRTTAGWELLYLFSREFDPGLDRKIVRSLTISTEYPRVKARRLGATLGDRAEAAARAALARVEGGAAFEDVAREVTEDETTRRAGGDMPNYRAGQLADEVDAALEAMKPGERRVVRSPRGTWVVEYTTALRTERNAVEPELRKELAGRAVTGGEIKRFVEELRARAKVEKRL